ncbi:MAG: hypothetical protein AAGL23_14605 [Pseudomonadota bacterium]
MGNDRFAHYEVFNLDWKDLEQIPEDHVAAISVLSYAVSEVNALRKIYLAQEHDLTDDKAVNSAINIHRFVVLRTWSSRLFEAVEFIAKGKKTTFLKDETLKELTETAILDFGKVSEGEGYLTARDVRNEATNHYSFKAAKKNLKHVPRSMDCNMYTAKQNGNEFYPMGEAVMFHARLDRRWADVATKEERDKRFRSWLSWNLDATRWLSETHARFAGELLFKPLGRRTFVRTPKRVSSGFAGRPENSLTPVYFQERD